MSWLGSLWNAAKVGVNLLNGIINPQSGVSQDFQSALLLNPAAAIRVEETGETHRIVSAFVAASSTPTRLGKTFHLFESGLIDEGDLVFAIVQDPTGALSVEVINNSVTTDYYVSFGQTSGVGALNNQPFPVGRKGGDIPNMVNLNGQFESFSLGNLVVTPIEIQSTMSPQLQSIPISTVLGNIGFSSIIAGASFLMYKSNKGKVTVEWQASGLSIGSYLVHNTTGYTLSVSANVNWSNPAIGSTVNLIVPPGEKVIGTLPDNDSPISSASVCAYVEGTSQSERKKIVLGLYEAVKADGLIAKTVKFAKSGKPMSRSNSVSSSGDSELTAKDKQLLAALKAIGGDDVLLKLGNASNGASNGKVNGKKTTVAQITFEDD